MSTLTLPHTEEGEIYVFSSGAIVSKSCELSGDSRLWSHIIHLRRIFGNPVLPWQLRGLQGGRWSLISCVLCVFAPNHKCLIIICWEIIRFLGSATINVKSAVCTPPLPSPLTRIILKRSERGRPHTRNLINNQTNSPSPENEIKIVSSHFLYKLSSRSDKW